MKRTCGFRFSMLDAIVIVLCGVLTWMLRSLGEMVLMFPVVLAHFFLFCNIFRVRQNYEFIWAGVFMANFGYWAVSNKFSWTNVLLCQAPVTAAFISAEMFSKRYHGIGSRWINAKYVELWVNGELD